jgi:hypothetical protein
MGNDGLRSSYIDTALSTCTPLPLKERTNKKQSKIEKYKLAIADIDWKTWDMMMKYLPGYFFIPVPDIFDAMAITP